MIEITTRLELMKELLGDLAERRTRSLAMGGPERVERQHRKGKMTVRERVDFLCDPGSFQEYGLLASHYAPRPDEPITPADGVVAGFGLIDGRHAAIIADDFTVHGGSIGPTNMYKRLRIMELAHKELVPLVFLFDGGGARAQTLGRMAEGLPLVSQFIAMARHSGLAPQVGAVLGPCAGESALEAALTEFSIMVRGEGMIAAGGPPVVLASLGLKVEKEELGGVDVHCRRTGTISNPAENDRDALEMVKRYLSYLPTNAHEYPPHAQPDDSPDRADQELLAIVPENYKKPYDMNKVIARLVDRGSFFEILPLFAPMMITGLARLNGHVIGIVANQPLVQAGAITAKAGQKQRHFIDLCNSYHIPLVFLVDTPGVMTGPQSEREGSLKFGLATAHSLAWADVPKFTVVIRKAFGFGGSSMCGYQGGQTLVLAWPTVDFASLPVDSAIMTAHGAELSAAADPKALWKKYEDEYKMFTGVYPAAASFNIDDVIDPRETRPRLIRALELSLNRRSARPGPAMRHGVMP
ncbi:MAG: carboxyl transferase domain-containing protein [Pseudomonadota bacterium]